MVGVCGEGLIITLLPDRRAGTIELTRVRYGYCVSQVSVSHGQGADVGKTDVPGEENKDRSQGDLANKAIEAFLRLARRV